jgi:glucose-1-phosphate cytidylyltransferase
MKVVILCGGQGTRIKELTDLIPKPMVDIGDKPILWHIMKCYSRFGYNEFVLALGYKGEIIKNYFLNYQSLSQDITVDLKSGNVNILEDYSEDWKITLVDTGEHSMTGSRIKQIEK